MLQILVMNRYADFLLKNQPVLFDHSLQSLLVQILNRRVKISLKNMHIFVELCQEPNVFINDHIV